MSCLGDWYLSRWLVVVLFFRKGLIFNCCLIVLVRLVVVFICGNVIFVRVFNIGWIFRLEIVGFFFCCVIFGVFWG